MAKKLSQLLVLCGLLILDLVIIQAVTLAVFMLRFPGGIPFYNFQAYVGMLPWLVLVTIGLLRIYGLLPARFRVNWSDLAASVVIVVIFYNILLMALSYLSRQFAFPRTVLLLQLVPQLVLLTAWRRILWGYQRTHRTLPRVFVIGAAEELGLLQERTRLSSQHWNWVGTCDPGQPMGQLMGQWQQTGADTIVLGRTIPVEQRRDIVARAVAMNFNIYLLPDFYDIAMKSAFVQQVEDMSLLQLNPKQIGHRNREIKRFFDLFLAVLILPLILALGLPIALAIWLESGRPVLYSQERVTTGGKPFKLYKFRTMHINAEKETGPVLAQDHDARITKVGRLLRACRLDELPQIINVLTGAMTLVGPRPERPFFIEQFNREVPGYAIRHRLRCGVTGLAQVNGRYSTRPEDKLIMDLEYGLNHSLWLDFKLILQTVKVILIKKSST